MTTKDYIKLSLIAAGYVKNIQIEINQHGIDTEYSVYGETWDYKEPDGDYIDVCATPSFKVGDWITDGNITIQIEDVRNNCYTYSNGVLYSTITADKVYHLWTIQDAKDGDVLAADMIKSHPSPFVAICKKQDGELFETYCFIGYDGKFYKGETGHVGKYVHPATKEQRDLLFAKMREAEYQWDADKKELRKIQHYDISNFHAGMPVLVRVDDKSEWDYDTFSRYRPSVKAFACSGGRCFFQCIPYEMNSNLLGTTDMPSREFINW